MLTTDIWIRYSKNKKKYFKFFSAEIFTQHAKY